MATVKPTARLRISEDWRIRIDGSHGIVYYFNPENLVWHTLPKEHLTALLLLDDGNSLGATAEILCDLLDIPPEKSRRLLDSLLASSNEEKMPSPFLEEGSCGSQYELRSTLGRLKDFTVQELTDVRNGRLPRPLSFTLMPTYRCSTDCVYCYSERPKQHKSEEMPIERWRELIREASQLEARLATFSGGDPMCYPGILDILEEMSEHNFRYILPTKTLVTKEQADRLATFNTEGCWFQVSVDTLDEKLAGKLVGVRDYPERAIQSITNMVAAGLPVRVNSVAVPENIHTIPALIRKLHQLGVKEMSVAGYGRTHYRHQESLFLSDEEMQWINEEGEKLKLELGWEDINCGLASRNLSILTPEEKAESWKDRSHCSGGRSCMVITPTGLVTLCEQIPLTDEYIVGDLSRQSIQEVWQSDKMRQFIHPDREQFAGTVCNVCDEFDECHQRYGHCFRDAEMTFGNRFMPMPSCPQAPAGIRMS